jgi:hypothetical protein
MTAPLENDRASEVDDRDPGPTRMRGGQRARRSHRQTTAQELTPTPSSEVQFAQTRRSKLIPFPVLSDGTIDLPDGAVLVALDFVDEGGLGYRRRPATAWAKVATEDPTDRSPGWSSPTSSA